MGFRLRQENVNLVVLLSQGNVKVSKSLFFVPFLMYDFIMIADRLLISCADISGHFGYIELPIPIYHPDHVSELKRMLSLLCLKCLKLKNRKVFYLTIVSISCLLIHKKLFFVSRVCINCLLFFSSCIPWIQTVCSFDFLYVLLPFCLCWNSIAFKY